MNFHDGKPRCDQIKDDKLYLQYHDHEWGIPVHDDQKLFEMLVLESTEAGLNWLLILKKRKNYRVAYDNFNPHRIASFDLTKEQELLNNKGLIRSKSKIKSSINNARVFLDI